MQLFVFACVCMHVHYVRRAHVYVSIYMQVCVCECVCECVYVRV